MARTSEQATDSTTPENSRLRVIVASTAFLLLYSTVAVGTKFLIHNEYGKDIHLMAVLLGAASCTGLLLGIFREGAQRIPRPTSIVALAVAGVMAAAYFIVVVFIGAGSADILETATTPLFLIIIAFMLFREKSDKNAIIGGTVAFAGFLVLISKSFGGTKPTALGDEAVVFILYPLLGAAGSAFAVAFTRKTIRAGGGRFWCVGFKNMLVATILICLAVWKWEPRALSLIGFIAATALGATINAVTLLAVYILKEAKGKAVTLAILYLLIPFISGAASIILGLPDQLVHFTPVFVGGLLMIVAGGVIAELWPTIRGFIKPYPPSLPQSS